MEHKGYFVLVLLGVFSIGGAAMIDVMNWQEQAEYSFTQGIYKPTEDLPTIEETISEMEESCQADITIDSIEIDVMNDIMIVEATAEPRTKEDKAQDIQWVEGIGFAGASCTPPATCSGTNTYDCASIGEKTACNTNPCCKVVVYGPPDWGCLVRVCSTFSSLDICNTCAGCSASCWTMTDDCALTVDTNVGGVFLNTGGSLVHTAGTLMRNCFKKVAADASYYKKNTTAMIRIMGASCPC